MINDSSIALSLLDYRIKFNILVITTCYLIDLSVLREFVRHDLSVDVKIIESTLRGLIQFKDLNGVSNLLFE